MRIGKKTPITASHNQYLDFQCLQALILPSVLSCDVSVVDGDTGVDGRQQQERDQPQHRELHLGPVEHHVGLGDIEGGEHSCFFPVSGTVLGKFNLIIRDAET